MDIWQAIRNDHQRVDALFEKIAESDDTAALIVELRAELEAHAQGEERAVYPELAKLDALKDMIGNAREDHEEMREILVKIEGADADELMDLVADLEEVVQDHVAEEEEDILPVAETTIDSGTAEAMLRGFEAAKKAAAKP